MSANGDARPRPLALTRPDRLVRVGHRGAAALAPANTIAAFEAAIAAGVDLVELDVVRLPDGPLAVAHSVDEWRAGAPLLDAALSWLSRNAPDAVGVVVDLKDRGFEREVVAALDRHRAVERALVTSVFADSLREVLRIDASVRTGLSYPWDRRGLSDRPAMAPVVRGAAAALRAGLPFRIVSMVAAAGASAAMLHHSVVSSRTVARLRATGVPVFAWTVDDPATLARVAAAGVAGVVSNDPGLLRDGRETRDPTG